VLAPQIPLVPSGERHSMICGQLVLRCSRDKEARESLVPRGVTAERLAQTTQRARAPAEKGDGEGQGAMGRDGIGEEKKRV